LLEMVEVATWEGSCRAPRAEMNSGSPPVRPHDWQWNDWSSTQMIKLVSLFGSLAPRQFGHWALKRFPWRTTTCSPFRTNSLSSLNRSSEGQFACRSLTAVCGSLYFRIACNHPSSRTPRRSKALSGVQLGHLLPMWPYRTQALRKVIYPFMRRLPRLLYSLHFLR